MKYYIGIDNGGTVIKACVYDETGRQLSVDRQQVPLLIPQEGMTERNLKELFAANVAAVKNAVRASGVNREDIGAIGISGHGKGLYLLDKQGNDLYNGIVSTDSRATEIRRQFDETGISALIYSQNCQKVLESQPVCLLRWLKLFKRDIYDQIGYVLSVKDYVRYKLTGKIAFERTDLSGSNLINLQTGKKDAEQLKLFGIEEMYSCIPDPVNACDNCGSLTEEAAKALGLTVNVCVSGGMFDIDACALSAGITNEENICVIAGTWSINEYISRKPVTAARSMNSYYCLPGYYLVEECSPTSAGNLEWFVQTLAKNKDYRAINAAVENISPENSDIIFLPFLFASNEKNLDLKGTFVNITAKTTEAELCRAVYEGITFAHKSHIDKLLSARTRPAAVRLTGGAANSDVWAQMFADVLDLPVEVISDREHGCFGAGISAAVACGMVPDAETALQKMVAPSRTFIPDEQKHRIYCGKYAKYKKLISALNKFYV